MCVPRAGGHASVLRRWDRARERQDIEVVSVCLFISGLGAGRESLVRTVGSGPASIRPEGRRSLGGSQG